MKKKQGGNLVCGRPEQFLEARFKLSKNENDILDMVLGLIKVDDNLSYEINIKDYIKLYDVSTKKDNIYDTLKKAVSTMEGKGFRLFENNGKFVDETFYVWFPKIKYIKTEGKILVDLHPEVKQMFNEMKQAIFYDIKIPLNFKNIYSQRFYYYLKKYQNTGYRIDRLEDLKEKLICPKSYSLFSAFRVNVLEAAEKEINVKSDINFTYQLIKEGTAVKKIKFLIKKVDPNRNKLMFNGQEMEQSKIDMPENDIDLITQIKNNIHKTMTEPHYISFIEPLIFEFKDQVLNISSDNTFILGIVKSKHLDIITKVLKDLEINFDSIEFSFIEDPEEK
jgi:plasmid replication initiation protein